MNGKPNRKLTAEEKAEKLRRMMEDGEAHDKEQFEKALQARRVDQKEEQEFLSRGDPEHKANFINKMNKEVYAGGLESMEDRLKKYQHYRQKGNVERLT